ncbi:TIGR03752 family integrating conjugative element protein [Xenorhabdus griffiniae]|uniref:TIGR03752 family integrating conjugative element protein n=1 Tax=Xenorhabdus griffiniae TaxID=351672 RepID=A0ABY9XES7_9GAMM|nr:TIGR03752 family integrating conjugative element protein [Xenorhabdus griffiniae]MBD1226004.1 TIGR03752 family integrating conjugative element protein [Xenorhabdus griffiniae]MBE8585878.1 TIGR03752 family integrating conjugative element protein [Xenorhabdus griffiniae]WMV71424.1 TIGR03752 family integrating conjugative element protein [Xenorhabdus griffiniae]WNH01101.1 TIGR03752 family integrating conjugative element protein [Xenorhabdus griffiniae]
MKVKSNTLVKVLVPSVLVVAILIGIKSCGADKPTSSTENIDQSLKNLDADELKALGIEGDTPEDTLRTLVGTLKKVRDKQNILDEQNQKLVAENEHLRTKSQDISGQINAAVIEVREEADRKQRALQTEQQTLMARLENLGDSFNLGNKSTNSSSDIPIGLGLDQQRESSVSYKGGVLWVDPQDAQPVDPSNNTSGYPAKPTYPMSFLEDNEITRQKAELDRTAKNQRTIDEGVEPAYTLPENSTLVGSQAMTALLGRVPIDGKVTDPYPFKVVVGKDNLTANGIDLPDVEGAVISGTATGDWTLSCVRGDITSITFVFADGTVRTVPQPSNRTDGSNNSGRNNGGAIGWLSDESGIPCISGERKTNAGTYLPTLFALTAAASAGDAFSQNQFTNQTNSSGGITSALTGDAGQAALGKAIGGGFKDVADWVKSRYGQTFDAVYVPPGKTVAVHITRQIPIDYEGKGRKVNYEFSLAGDMESELD